MATLYILEDDEPKTQLLAVKLGKIDHKTATVAVMQALAEIEPKKRERSDKGTKRPPKLELVNPTTGERATIDLPHVANGERSQVIP